MKFICIFLFLFSIKASALTTWTLDKQQMFSITTSPLQVLPNDPIRTYLMVQNQGTDIVYLRVGTTFTGTEGILIPGGSNYEFSAVPQDKIYLKSNSGVQTVIIMTGH